MGTKKRSSIKFTALILVVTLLLSIIPTGIGLAAYEPPQGDPPQSPGKYEGSVDEKPDINELTSEADNMTEAEQKMSSAILKLSNSDFLPEGVSQSDVLDQIQEFGQAGATDEVYVYIKVSGGADFDAIKPYVSRIENSSEDKGLAAAWVNIDALGDIAALDDVISIREVVAPIVYQGSVTTEGDAIHNTDDVRSTYGVNGSGIKVGILSDGVDSLASAVSSGDLPGDVTVLSNTYGGDEGTAMLEIVYDMAPGADLYFHDCGDNVVAFCDAIDDLVAAGCDVICDDIGWLLEPYFADGTVASHIDSVLSSTDIVYTSSAGNGATSHHQSTFYDDGYGYHDFSNGSDPTLIDLYAYIPSGGAIQVIMQWNEAFGSAGSDYDLFLYDMTNNTILTPESGYEGTDVQNGNDDPLERLIYVNDTGGTIDVAIWAHESSSSVDRVLEVNIYSYGGDNYSNNITAADSIFGHPAVPDVIACGAIDQADSGNDDIEPFSSCGPVTMIGTTRQKPDICGIDGVSVTGAGGFPSTFFGTSAAAPHIAAVAALLRSQYPVKTSSEIRSLILDNAVDLGSSGYDNTFGYGRCDALAASVAGGGTTPPTGDHIYYRSHVQDIGWQDYVCDGEVSGTSGMAKRLEGMNIYIDGETDAIEYRTHVEHYGWMDWVADGAMTGTSNEAKRLEAIEIRLTGAIADEYDVYYRVHAQSFGWLDWTSNGLPSGTAGYGYRLEAIEILLVEKGDPAPGPTDNAFVSSGGSAPDGEFDIIATAQPLTTNHFFVDGVDYEYDHDYYTFIPSTTGTYRFKTVGNTDTVGYLYNYTPNEEDLDANLIDWNDDSDGLNFMIEAFLTAGEKFILKVKGFSDSTGYYEVVAAFTDVGNDICYQSHVQNIGWQEYRCNGAASGTSNQALRLEAMVMYIDGMEGVLEYRTHVQNIGWQDWVTDGEMTGTSGLALRLEAIDIRLIDGLENTYDVYYRVHAQNFGWLDWASNGASSGTAGFGYRLEAIEVRLVYKGDPAPGPTGTPFISSY